jgi:hypothetical protein
VIDRVQLLLDADSPANAVDAVPNAPRLLLPGDFWSARPMLRHIRQAAHSRMCSADAVLHGVLARVAAGTGHTVKLPPIVGSASPLCYFATILGPSGAGKSSSNRVAGELVPVEELPPGSGEGMVDALFETVKVENEDGKIVAERRQTRFAIFMYLDEGEALAVLGGRSGSTLLPTIRAIWSGQVIGNTNASFERKRVVPAGQYAYGLVVAMQESVAGPLIEDAGAGTPQRFVWASAIDPTVPDQPEPWPGTLGWEPLSPSELARYEGERTPYVRHVMRVPESVAAEVWARQLARTRGDVVVDILQAHRDLLRLKAAGLLALLDRRMDVSDEDWALAGVLVDTSDRVLAHAMDVVAHNAFQREAQTSARLARRHVDAAAAQLGWRTTEAARRIATKVRQNPGVLVSNLRRDLRRWRDEFEEALTHAKAEGWVIERSEPGRGSDKRALYPEDAR